MSITKVGSLLGLAALLTAIACSSSNNSDGSGPGTCSGGTGKSANSACDSCGQDKCAAEFTSCFGAGYKSGSFSGPCAGYASCAAACTCGDTKCYAACGPKMDASCQACVETLDTCQHTTCASACGATSGKDAGAGSDAGVRADSGGGAPDSGGGADAGADSGEDAGPVGKLTASLADPTTMVTAGVANHGLNQVVLAGDPWLKDITVPRTFDALMDAGPGHASGHLEIASTATSLTFSAKLETRRSDGPGDSTDNAIVGIGLELPHICFRPGAGWTGVDFKFEGTGLFTTAPAFSDTWIVAGVSSLNYVNRRQQTRQISTNPDEFKTYDTGWQPQSSLQPGSEDGTGTGNFCTAGSVDFVAQAGLSADPGAASFVGSITVTAIPK